MTYPIQVVEPTYQAQIALRRFRMGQPYDSATVVIGREVVDMGWLGEMVLPEMVDIRLDDPRWPTVGDAGLPLTPQHEHQVCHYRLFRRPDGVLQTADELPFGSAYELLDQTAELAKSYWAKVSREYQAQHAGRRGLYMIKLPTAVPQGQWFSPDWMWGRASNPEREGWTVTGDLADLVVTPSVNAPDSWHGYIGSNGTPPGHLSRDLDGRSY